MRQRKYQRLPDDDSVQEIPKRKKKFADFVPEQFCIPQRPIPWTAICYATLLFVIGTVLLLCGCLIHVGHVDSEVMKVKICLSKISNLPNLLLHMYILYRNMGTDCGL